MIILPILTTSLLHFFQKVMGECALSLGVKELTWAGGGGELHLKVSQVEATAKRNDHPSNPHPTPLPIPSRADAYSPHASLARSAHSTWGKTRADLAFTGREGWVSWRYRLLSFYEHITRNKALFIQREDLPWRAGPDAVGRVRFNRFPREVSETHRALHLHTLVRRISSVGSEIEMINHSCSSILIRYSATLGSRGFSPSEIWGRNHGRRGTGSEAPDLREREISGTQGKIFGLWYEDHGRLMTSTHSLPIWKSTFSQPFKEKFISDVVRI